MRTVEIKYLVKIGNNALFCQRAVTYNKVLGLFLRNFCNYLIGDSIIKPVNQKATGNIKNLFTADNGFGYFAWKQNNQVQHDLKQQIFKGADFSYVFG